MTPQNKKIAEMRINSKDIQEAKINGKIVFRLNKDTTPPTIEIFGNGGNNPNIHAFDTNSFTVVVKQGDEIKRMDSPPQNSAGTYDAWFGIGYLGDGTYDVVATDEAGNVSTAVVTIKI